MPVGGVRISEGKKNVYKYVYACACVCVCVCVCARARVCDMETPTCNRHDLPSSVTVK